MSAEDQKREPLTKRERIAIRLIMFAVKLLSPWQYSHQFDKLIEAIEKELGE